MRFQQALQLLTVALVPLASCLTSAANAADPEFKVARQFAVGEDGRWDYVTVDPAAKRLYVPRTNRVLVIDTDSGKTIATAAKHKPDGGGIHGVALATDLGRGYTSDGKDNTVTLFDLKSFETLGTLNVGKNPDGILFDAFSKQVFTFNGKSHDASVFPAAIDPAKPSPITTIDLGGKPETPVTDAKGTIFVNIEDKNEIARIDTNTLKVTAHWSIAPGEEPTGLAFDVEHHRLFATCGNNMMVVLDSQTGKIIATVPVGMGTDAAGFDPALGLAFSSNGEGTLTVVHEDSPDKFSVVQTVATQKGARTMALDPVTHTIYLPTSKFAPLPPDAEGKKRPDSVPGSFTILVVEQ